MRNSNSASPYWVIISFTYFLKAHILQIDSQIIRDNSGMQLKVRVENNTIIARYFLAEPAVCYLIRDGGKKILFDVGYSDIFIENAHRMNESLLDVDYVVLSHGHNDHTGGLVPLTQLYAQSKGEGIAYNNPTVVAHPEAFSYKAFAGGRYRFNTRRYTH